MTFRRFQGKFERQQRCRHSRCTSRKDIASNSRFLTGTKPGKKIADILSAYDDLIENNRRRIALLEEAARLLYREWFVHFRFPGHEHVKIIDGLPEGWERSVSGKLSRTSIWQGALG